jgi:hypothetical protein
VSQALPGAGALGSRWAVVLQGPEDRLFLTGARAAIWP